MPAKGSYNPRTGRIRINPSRHATAEDVRRTVLHETIGHGLQQQLSPISASRQSYLTILPRTRCLAR
ncbi:MAG: hypothetical protein IKZ14_08530 [Muribaculaceae bacterium]|nr:hypothetical protein [Muribaculaceae bacterium]